jgi:putative peptide zinc metalloprotease protein
MHGAGPHPMHGAGPHPMHGHPMHGAGPHVAGSQPIRLPGRPPEPAPGEYDFELESTSIEPLIDPDPLIEPESDPPEPDQPAPSPDEVAEQEQAELWRAAQVQPWYKRTWVRALLTVAALTGVAAIVPYPLRITSECTIIPAERAKIRSELQGVISEILVDEGHAVKKGDVIARLDDRALKAERLKVLAEIDKIEAELETLRQGHRREEFQQQEAIVAARRNEVVFGAKEANRRNQMAREGIGSRQAAEAASRELEGRRRALDEAQAALRLLKAGTRPEEIAAHEAVLKRAQAELAYVDERLAMTVIRAPIDGEILTPRFREHIHEGVEAGGLICEIANMRRMRAEVLTAERELDVIALGMPVLVKVESYPVHPFEGKVDFIAPAVDGEDKRLRVVVELDNATGMLKANMTGFGEVETGKHSLLDLATRRILRWVRVRYLL